MSRISRMLQDSEVIFNLTMNVINTTFLLGKLTARVSELITHLAYTALKFVGMIYLHAQVLAVVKSGCDSAYALAHRHWDRFSYAAAMTFVQGSNIGLTVLGTVAATCVTLSQTATAQLLYVVLRPWGLVALAIQILLEVVCHLTDDALLARMNAIKDDAKHVLAFFQAYQPEVKSGTEASYLAAAARNRIDPITWKILEQKALKILKENQLSTHRRLQEVFRDAIKNIGTQRAIARADLSLRVVNYFAMAATRAYPGTLLEGVINWTTNGFWSIRVYVAKYHAAGQQESILRV